MSPTMKPKLADNSIHSDAMATGDLPQALSLTAFAPDGFVVQLQWIATDVTAFEPDTAHARAGPLDNKIAFQFRDRADDEHHGSAQRAARIDLFAEANELDVEAIDLSFTSFRASMTG
jgi:hypothetical protein